MTGPRAHRAPTLFDHARQLHQRTPDAPLPDGGAPLPDQATRTRARFDQRRAALAAVLREFRDHPDLPPRDLHDRCATLPITAGDANVVRAAVPDPTPRQLDTARWLIRHGTHRSPVVLGLHLLAGHAEPADIPLLTTIGRLGIADRPALTALLAIPGAEPEATWLADRSRNHARRHAVTALAQHQDPTVRDWVLATPPELLPSELARTIAEAHDLPRLLGEPTDIRWDQVGGLLLAMADTRDRTQIGHYRAAPDVYPRWAALAADRTPALDRAALLASVAADLRTGPAALAVGDPRHHLATQLRSVLTSPAWQWTLRRAARSGDPVTARRATWALTEAAAAGPPGGRFAIRVVVPDPNPAHPRSAETRILIDGVPVVAAWFDRGPAEPPEHLLDTGALRATHQPREVRLAEACCTEGCCGALHVTILRQGSEVVWRDWRSSRRGDPPPEFRFDAAEYDREVTRAEQDRDRTRPRR